MRLSVWPVVILLAGVVFLRFTHTHPVQQDRDVRFVLSDTKAIGSTLLDSSKQAFHLPPLPGSALDGAFLIFPEQAVDKNVAITFLERMGTIKNLSGAWGTSSALSLQTKDPITLSRPVQVHVPFPDKYWEKALPVAFDVDVKGESCSAPPCLAGGLTRKIPVEVDEEEKRFVFELTQLPTTVTWYYVPRAH